MSMSEMDKLVLFLLFDFENVQSIQFIYTFTRAFFYSPSLSGPNCEVDWARESRRIIPLLRRATPLTAFAPLAEDVKRAVGAQNRTMLAPGKTRTPKHRARSSSIARASASTSITPRPTVGMLTTSRSATPMASAARTAEKCDAPET